MLNQGYHYNDDLQSDYNKYGRDNFEFSVVETIETPDEDYVFEREKYYISLYRESYDCYNETDGGLGANGTRLTKERIAQLTELNRKLMTGKKMSDETRAKMSETRLKNRERAKGKYMQQLLTEKEVIQIKKDLMAGSSCKELSIKYNVSVACISKINVGANWKSVRVKGWNEYLKNRI